MKSGKKTPSILYIGDSNIKDTMRTIRGVIICKANSNIRPLFSKAFSEGS